MGQKQELPSLWPTFPDFHLQPTTKVLTVMTARFYQNDLDPGPSNHQHFNSYKNLWLLASTTVEFFTRRNRWGSTQPKRCNNKKAQAAEIPLCMPSSDSFLHLKLHFNATRTTYRIAHCPARHMGPYTLPSMETACLLDETGQSLPHLLSRHHVPGLLSTWQW